MSIEQLCVKGDGEIAVPQIQQVRAGQFWMGLKSVVQLRRVDQDRLQVGQTDGGRDRLQRPTGFQVLVEV
jgi:hypothetical protein